MHVEKGNAVSFRKRPAFDVDHSAANLAQSPRRNMAWDERIRNSGQSAFLQMNVRPANLAQLHVE